MLKDSILREIRRMTRYPVYLVMMIVVPIGCALFFISLMHEGLPLKVPTAIVDLDHSTMSRQITRSLSAMELVEIADKEESYSKALAAVRRGDIFGFFVIPENFEKDALGGRTPTLDYYTNMTFFVPGTLSFKGFKTMAMTTSGGVVKETLTSVGLSDGTIGALIQPVNISNHPIGNPWLNYTYYLTPSFSFAALALIIMLMTIFTITIEIKRGTSTDWIATARGNIYGALAGKLIPQSAVFCAVALAIDAILFGFMHFPMNGSMAAIALATVLFVIATQSLGLLITCALPNPRLALSIASLVGILTFSFAGFSFPVEKMYGAIGIFSYIVPVRYWFLIYINQALNGFDVYYVRFCFAALLIFPLIGWVLAPRLRRACLKPVYVP